MPGDGAVFATEPARVRAPGVQEPGLLGGLEERELAAPSSKRGAEDLPGGVDDDADAGGAGSAGVHRDLEKSQPGQEGGQLGCVGVGEVEDVGAPAVQAAASKRHPAGERCDPLVDRPGLPATKRHHQRGEHREGGGEDRPGGSQGEPAGDEPGGESDALDGVEPEDPAGPVEGPEAVAAGLVDCVHGRSPGGKVAS